MADLDLDALALRLVDIANAVEAQGSAEAFDVPVMLREVVAALRGAVEERNRLRLEIAYHVCTLPDSIKQALNEGDGVYRP